MVGTVGMHQIKACYHHFRLYLYTQFQKGAYDYEKYGDSPACLGADKDLDGQVALVQGFGITEDGTPPDGILEANVTIISNSQCEQEMSNLKSKYSYQ